VVVEEPTSVVEPVVEEPTSVVEPVVEEPKPEEGMSRRRRHVLGF
jgi:hypothetical protein